MSPVAQGATLDNSLNVLQIHYGKRLHIQTNDRVNIWNMIPKHPDQHTGRFRQENLTTGYPATGGAFGPGASLPTAGNTSDALTNIYHCYLYYPISVDWDAYHQSSGKASFVDVMTREMNRVKAYMFLDLERMVLGNGSGLLSAISVVTVGATSLTFEVPNEFSPRFIEGQRIVFFALTSGEVTETSAVRGVPAGQYPYYTISSSVEDGATTTNFALITCTGSAPAGHGIAAGDGAFKYGAIQPYAISGTNHAGTELMGLKGICSQGAPPLRTATKATYPAVDTFQAIDPSSAGYWKTPTINLSGAELDQTWFDKLGVRMIRQGSTPPEDVRMWVLNPVQEEIYKRNLYGGERYPITSSPPSFPTGSADSMNEKRYLHYAGRPLVCSRFCDTTEIYGVGPDIYRYDCKPWGFHKPGFGSGGSIWHQDFDRRAADQAEAYAIMQFGTTARNRHARLTGAASS